MKSKWILGLVAAALVMVLAPASFAQVRIEITTFASPGEINTNHNALTVDPASTGTGIQISGLFIATAKLTTTVLTLTFSAPITSAPAVFSNPGTNAPAFPGPIPAADPIRIEGQSGLFAGITAVATVAYAGGTIQINLPCANTTDPLCPLPDNTGSGTFRILGVRLDVNGETAPITVEASLSSGANNYLAPTSPTATVITTLGDGLGDPVIGTGGVQGANNNGSAILFTNQLGQTLPVGATTNASIFISEGFASAWRTATQMTPTPLTPGVNVPNGTQVRITANNLPTGVTLNITCFDGTAPPCAASPGTQTPRRPAIALTSAALTRPATSTSTSNRTIITFTSAPSLTAVDNIQLQLTLTGTPTANLTAGTNITLTMTIDPLADAFDTNGFPTITGGYPKFVESTKTLIIATVSTASTTLLIPYSVRISSLNFETGIAIANTTADPFTTGGAIAQAGTVTIDIFPSTATGAGTRSTYVSNTANRAGSGMTSDGTVPAGATWAVNLTDILSKASPAITGDFSGYLFIQTNFLNAHGVAYIYDGRGFTSNTPALVMPPPGQTSRSSVSFEALDN
jgi:hypothetical protein